MMFHSLSGLAATTGCSMFSSWSDPLCLYSYAGSVVQEESGQSPNSTLDPTLTQSVTGAYVPGVPGEAYVAGVAPGGAPNAQSASDTTNAILTMAAQSAAAAGQATADQLVQQQQQQQQQQNKQPSSGVCATSPNSIMCWLSQNSGMVFTIGLAIAGVAFIMPPKGRGR